MIEWKIYYGDGSTFDSSQGGPEEAPPIDVIAVVKKSENGFDILHLKDWYVYRTDIGWFRCNTFGMIDQVMYFTDKVMGVKQGRVISDDAFAKISKKIHEDKDIQKQTAVRKFEIEQY